jgi:hypothetical protein
MGTGHSIDTPIRVAHWGIDSVISIVDDLLVERIRKHYAAEYGLPFTQIARNAVDGRARRISAYLDTVHTIVQQHFEEVKQSSFDEADSLKNKYFAMLPEVSPFRGLWEAMKNETDALRRQAMGTELAAAMRPGSIDVNVMTKLDHLANDESGKPLSSEFSDACAAIRGYAESVVDSAVILSAGFNPRVYGYIANFPQFYRDTTGHIRKKIILKVSDFRSALIQGKFLAKYGLEIAEFRIESGLNCGGHAFYSDGKLLPAILQEFKEKKISLPDSFVRLSLLFTRSKGGNFHTVKPKCCQKSLFRVELVIYCETRRLLEDYTNRCYRLGFTLSGCAGSDLY